MQPLRSMLFVSVLKNDFQESAARSQADAIILDLEDSIPISEKDNARQKIRVAVEVLGQNRAKVIIRINDTMDHLKADLEASIIPGVSSLMIPKVESAAKLTEISQMIDTLEKERSLEPNSIRLDVTIETAKGLLSIREILGASNRIISIGFGAGDFCRDLDIKPGPDGRELLYAFSSIITHAKAFGINAIGVLGTLFNVEDIERFEQMAVRSRRMGSTGSPCVHPKQAEILNRVFSPSREDLAWARRVVTEYDKRSKRGEGPFALDGKMIYYANYRQAKGLLERDL